MFCLNLSTLSLFIFVLLNTGSALAHQQRFECSKFNPSERTIQKPASCNDNGGYELITEQTLERPELNQIFGSKTKSEIEKDDALKDLALEAKFRMTSNMNGARFTFPSGITRVVFRGSYLAPQFSETSVLKAKNNEIDRNRSCMSQLVKDYQLSKVVNYDELDWPSAIRMTKEEELMLKELNPKSTYWKFTENNGRTFQYKFSKAKGDSLDEKKRDVMNMVASIIKEVEGDPRRPGAVYLHCYGGHHRTGAVYGVLQKCMGKMPVEDILSEYKCHIGYQSKEQPGGYHLDNETLIREFPCDEYFKP